MIKAGLPMIGSLVTGTTLPVAGSMLTSRCHSQRTQPRFRCPMKETSTHDLFRGALGPLLLGSVLGLRLLASRLPTLP